MLVLGVAFVVGGLKNGPQTLRLEPGADGLDADRPRGRDDGDPVARARSSTHPPQRTARRCRSSAPVVLLTLFVLTLPSFLAQHARRGARACTLVGSRQRRSRSAVAGAAAAFTSDWFVTALTPAIHTLHMSEEFAGLVIVAIAGNAVENVVGVQLAARNKADFAVSVIVNSSLQIALALTPVLVFVSLLFATHLTLVFPTLLAFVLLLAGILGALIVNDGESTWEEGAVLVGFYVVIAASFWWGTS